LKDSVDTVRLLYAVQGYVDPENVARRAKL
jgi:hypothetical protein